MSLEVKEDLWPKVKEYYEKAYKVKFHHRLGEAKIQFLHEEMLKLGRSVQEAYEAGKPYLLKLIHFSEEPKTPPIPRRKPVLAPQIPESPSELPNT